MATSTVMDVREQMREEQRRKNRERMPNLAALMDDLREQFPDCRLVWGKDLVTGHEVGKKEEPDPDRVFVIPPDYHPSRPLETKKGKR